MINKINGIISIGRNFSMASLVHQHLMDKGVNLYLEQAVASFSRDGRGLKVTFKNGQSISADIVILSIGVRPETNLARAAELTIGPAGGIAVNDYLQTSDESIYAIGVRYCDAEPVKRVLRTIRHKELICNVPGYC